MIRTVPPGVSLFRAAAYLGISRRAIFPYLICSWIYCPNAPTGLSFDLMIPDRVENVDSFPPSAVPPAGSRWVRSSGTSS